MNRFSLATLCFCLSSFAHAADSRPTLPAKELDELLATYALVKAQYVQQPDDGKLFAAAMQGMLASLDPHSQYLDKQAFAEMEEERSGEYAGIGIEVEMIDGRMSVVSVIDGSPADLAGMQANDSIVSIDGRDIATLREAELGKRMRGLPGSKVTVGYRQGGKPRSATLTRAALQLETVRTSMAAPGVAWIRISQFEGRTAADLAAALASLDAKGAPRGIVLDLRNDPGGLVAAGVGVTGAFLPRGTVVFSARGRLPGANSTVTVDERFYRAPGEADALAKLPSWTRSVPLTVLVNGASASAAELVAGALQDHGRAQVVGTQTFGKGSIQSVYPLAQGGAVKLTVARYFTPKGKEIQARGIAPDLVVAPRTGKSGADGLALRESDLALHLEAAQEAAPGTALPRQRVESSRMFGTREDAALAAAVALLAPGGSLPSSARALLQTVGSQRSF